MLEKWDPREYGGELPKHNFHPEVRAYFDGDNEYCHWLPKLKRQAKSAGKCKTLSILL